MEYFHCYAAPTDLHIQAAAPPRLHIADILGPAVQIKRSKFGDSDGVRPRVRVWFGLAHQHGHKGKQSLRAVYLRLRSMNKFLVSNVGNTACMTNNKEGELAFNFWFQRRKEILW